jgi:hypothetical protein
MSTTPAPTDPDAIRELVALRIMLDEACRRAGTANRYSRGAAVVALDATVERVAYLVALRRNLDFRPKATLNEMHSKLVEDIGAGWRTTVWGQIRNLHEARNSAQHKGLAPDREEIPGWITATRAYVHSLVQAEYSVDLDTVVLADAIANEQLAGLVRVAGERLAAGDIPGSVRASEEAFDAAVAAWSRLHKRPQHRPASSFDSRLGYMGDDEAGKAIAVLDRQTAEASFASSGAEHEWFRAARKEKHEVLDADDADRILAFVFSWIVSFEVAASEWVPDRRHRSDVAARRVRAGSETARIAEVGPVKHRGIGVAVRFQLDHVPDHDSYDQWAQALGRLLPSGDGRRWWVAPDGTVELTTFNGARPGEGDVVLLAQALTDVEHALAAELTERAQAAAERDAQKAGHEAALEPVRDRLPDWVTSLTWTPSAVASEGPGWKFTVLDAVRRLRFGPAEDPMTVAQNVDALIRAHPQVGQCFGVSGGTMITPLLPAADVVEVFRTVDAQVRQDLAEAEGSQFERETRLHEVEAELTAALVRSRDTT